MEKLQERMHPSPPRREIQYSQQGKHSPVLQSWKIVIKITGQLRVTNLVCSSVEIQGVSIKCSNTKFLLRASSLCLVLGFQGYGLGIMNF